MSLELLANEILLDLFEYLDAINLVRAFHGLNDRFNQLLLIKLQRYYLDFCSISKRDFEIFCQQYFSSINDRIISLHLSDDDETPNLPQIFFSSGYYINQFIHLKSLSIRYIYSYDLLNQIQIISQCHELSYLTHLTIIINNNPGLEEHFRDFINNIWSLPKLSHCYLDITYRYTTWPFDISIISQSINYLSLKNLSYTVDSLFYLFKHTPDLQRLYIGNISESNDQQMQSIFPSLISLTMIVENSVLWMKNLFQKIPNLSYLILEIKNIYLDGHEWEKIFNNYLKNIKVFRFKMRIEFSLLEDLEEQVDRFLDSFRSYYWTEKHQWFVRCDWYPMDMIKTGLLYTLPYAFDTFYYKDDTQSKSTSPHELNDYFYNRVQNLYHTNRKQNLCINWTSSPIRFVNIRHLIIKFPFNDTIWSVISRLDRLISLDASLNHDFGYSQLQMLLDRAPRLYSLRFCYLNNFSMNSFNISSTSIRRLEFFQSVGYDLRYFNTAECAALARLSIASQCQVLIIDVENRRNIVELIQTMPNIRMLSVRCKYDQTHTYYSSEMNNKLIEWLHDQLPFKFTCSLIHNSNSRSSFNLWIHK